jgi:23S rRNA pseudouridine1911/1915/1917 synthase
MKDEIRVLYEDKDFLAVYKPANLLVHATINSKEPTLVDWLVKKYPEIRNVGDPPAGGQASQIRPGIVHRLDKDTSGVILIARNQKYFEYLKNLFQTRQIRKNYLALVWGEVHPVRNGVSNGVKPKSGVIEKPIALKSGSIKRTVWEGKMEKQAITEYQVLKYFTITNSYDRKSLLYFSHPRKSASNPRQSATFSLLKVFPKTGRTHQIRVHLASIGHPVVGDSLYGKKENPFGLKRLFLHAESLEFSPAEGKRIKVEAELPEDLKNALKKLKTKKA